jgi:hypothetical protein
MICESWFDSWERKEIFLFIITSTPFLGLSQLPIEWVLREERLESEDDHCRVSSTEVKNEWSCISTPLLGFMACKKTTFSFIV